MPEHLIFNYIEFGIGHEEDVQQHVLADPAVLDERTAYAKMTPLIYTICWRQASATALWLIEHRGQHDLDSRDKRGFTALWWACKYGLLPVVQALLAAGANAALLFGYGWTVLMKASDEGHADVVACLLQQPAVRATIDVVDVVSDRHCTALSIASFNGHEAIVQALLDAGADTTSPGGEWSPLSRAIDQGHAAIAALLRRALERDRTRILHKARSLFEAPPAVDKARSDARDKGESLAVQELKAIAAAPVFLKGRVERDEALPAVEMAPKRHGYDERLRATMAFVVGLEEGGVQDQGLPQELYEELRGQMNNQD